MNEIELENGTSHDGATWEESVRENPTRTILFALGAGLTIALLVRALQPRPPQSRAAQILEDLHEQLNSLAEPARRRANGLAKNGAHLLHQGADHLSHLHIERRLNRWARKLRNLF